MQRGELYVAGNIAADPRRERVVLLVSRQRFLDSSYSKVVCIPIYSRRGGLETEVELGPDEGLKHDSAARCDEVLSLLKRDLRRRIGQLSDEKLRAVNRAVAIALDVRPEDIEDL